MKSKQRRSLSLNGKERGELRYCSRCKTKVQFTDSGKIRQNANGKNIFVYAIYKCGKDHTWNKKMGVRKAVDR